MPLWPHGSTAIFWIIHNGVNKDKGEQMDTTLSIFYKRKLCLCFLKTGSRHRNVHHHHNKVLSSHCISSLFRISLTSKTFFLLKWIGWKMPMCLICAETDLNQLWLRDMVIFIWQFIRGSCHLGSILHLHIIELDWLVWWFDMILYLAWSCI